MWLVLRRAVDVRTLLAVGALITLITTGLLTALIQYSQLMPAAGARAITAAAPVYDRTITVSSGAPEPDRQGAHDKAVRGHLAAGLDKPDLLVHSGGYAIAQRLPDDFRGLPSGQFGTFAVITFLDALPEHADLATGAWPQPVPADRPAQVALPEDLGRRLGLEPGDILPITDERLHQPKPVEVVGLFRPKDPADAYWQLSSAPIDAGGIGPMVVHPDEFATRYLTLSTLKWIAVPDLADLSDTELWALTDRVGTLISTTPDDIAPQVQMRSGLVEHGVRLATAVTVATSGMLLPVLLFAVIAGYGLLLVARLLGDHRQSENAMLRARGAGRIQLAAFAAGEALLVVLPAVVLAPPLAAQLLRWIDGRSADTGLTLLLEQPGAFGSSTAWIIAAAVAAGCLLALVAPSARRGGTWVAQMQTRGRVGASLWAARAGLDVALVVVALVAISQLRTYSDPVTATASQDSRLGIDPLLVSAPTLAVLAATVLCLRLLPLVTRWAVRVAGRNGSFSRLLGLWQAQRRPHAGLVLLLVLSVGAGALAVSVAATWQLSQRDQAAHLVGSDLRVATGADLPALPQLPGVTGTMAVHRHSAQVGSQQATLLAIDSKSAADVIDMRPDLAEVSIGELAGRLVVDQQAPSGVQLPGGASRVAGQIDVSGETLDDRVHGNQVLLYLQDELGLVHTLRLGQVDRSLTFDVALPAGSWRLVGILSGGRIDSIGSWWVEPTVRTVVNWQLIELFTVDDSGRRTPIGLPDEWRVDSADRGGVSSERQGDVVQSVVTHGIEGGANWQFMLAGRPTPSSVPLPVLATPEVLRAAGTGPDQIITINPSGRLPLNIKVVGTIAALPGTENARGIVIDLSALAIADFSQRLPSLLPNELWLATSEQEHAAAAAAVATDRPVLADRRELTRQMLDNPLGSGVLLPLYAAVLVATLLAGFGLVIDARSTALRRTGEMAVLHTLGTSPRALARAFLVEQSVLAGLGVLTGVAVGVGVAAVAATSLVPTAEGTTAVPEPLLSVPPWVVAPGVALFVAALLLGMAVSRRARLDVLAGVLRIGGDR